MVVRFQGPRANGMPELHKLIPPLGRWRRFEPKRAAIMRAELERVLAIPGISRDLYEQVSKSLG